MNENTIEALEVEKCTGCGACNNICPTNAISLVKARGGFLYPGIDSEMCIDCGLCQKHCPEFNQEEIQYYDQKELVCYAMMAADEVRHRSSAGGMFTVLSNYILDRGGVVCGAGYSADFTEVYHTIVSNKEDLDILRGIKYVQSDTRKVHKEVRKFLKDGKSVLFTGYPCQIAGIKRYLEKPYDNLITLDLICPGVPSPEMYKKYIKEKSNGRILKKVDFREKEYWGWGTATSLFFEDGSTYRGDCFSDDYWLAFASGMSTRTSCGQCNYSKPQRVGDFTIGDFWGVSQIDESLDDKLGTCLVMVNNSKAKSILEEVKDQCLLLEKVELNNVLETAKTRNKHLLLPTPNHWAQDRFIDLLEIKTFSEAVKYISAGKYDVGIMGWWYNENYGGALTYFALYQVLKKMGLSTLMIAKCSWNKDYKPKEESVPYRFAKKNYYISKNYTPDTIGVLNHHCQTFISGSDQLFNPSLWEYSGPQYFLDYVWCEKNIISYASSFGNGFVDTKNLTTSMSYWLHRFNALSVRESYGEQICEQVFGLNAEKVMDPVFLCDAAEYEKQALKTGLKKEENYMVSFFLDPDSQKRNAILELSEKLNLPYINLLHAMDFEKNRKALNLDNIKWNIDIEEWLFYYLNSDFVITDSFHGTCFAIIFRKKFISVANYQRGEMRFISLLEEVGLMDRLVYSLDEINERPDLLEDINYDDVYERISPIISQSYTWLENAIKNPESRPADLFNMLDSEINRLRKEIYRLKNE